MAPWCRSVLDAHVHTTSEPRTGWRGGKPREKGRTAFTGRRERCVPGDLDGMEPRGGDGAVCISRHRDWRTMNAAEGVVVMLPAAPG